MEKKNMKKKNKIKKKEYAIYQCQSSLYRPIDKFIYIMISISSEKLKQPK